MQSSPLTNESTDSSLGLFYGAGAVLFWSIGALLFCHLTAVPLFQYIALTQITGGVVCILLSGKSLRPQDLVQRLYRSWPLVLFLGISQLAYAIAFRTAPPVHADLINYLWPMMLVIGEATRRSHALTPQHYLGMATGFLGIFVLLLPDLSNHMIELSWIVGYFSAFIGALAWTAYSIYGADTASRSENSHSGEDILIVGLISATIQLAHSSWAPLENTEWILITLLGTCVYGIAFPLWKKGLQHGHYTTMAGMANLIPVLSIAWLIFGGIATFSIEIVIASLLVTSSCWILQRTSATEEDTPQECPST